MSVEIQKTEDVIITSTENVSVGLKSAEDVQGNSEVAVEAKLKKWTVVGDDIYIANQAGALPLWFQSILDTQISNSTLAGGVDLLTTNFNNFETGYNQTIVEINNGIDGLTSNVNTLLNDNGINKAAILDIQTTKVDANGAAAAAQTVIGAWENDPLGGGAFFEEKVFATKSLIQSAVDTVEIIQADYGGVSAKVQSLENVSVAPDGSWTAGVSKLITAPDGGITGWEFTDGSNTGSDMSIYATNFKITDGTTNETPFSIAGNKVNFNGVVDFTNTNLANGYPGTTQINGGLIKTDSIWVDGSIRDTLFNTTPNYTTGFQLKANAVGNSADPSIYGAYIKGGTIESANVWLLSDGGTTRFSDYTYRSGKYVNWTIPGNSGLQTTYTPYIRIYSPTYGSGHISSRVKSFIDSSLLIKSSGAIAGIGLPNSDHEIQISKDSGAWTKLDPMTTYYGIDKLYSGSVPTFTQYADIRLKINYFSNFDNSFNVSASISLELINT